MPASEPTVLATAIAALHRTTGLSVGANGDQIHDEQQGEDDIVQIEAQGRKHRFIPELKMVDRFETPAQVKHQRTNGTYPPILVAPYITRETAQRCRDLKLAFMDTAGNAYVEAPGLLIYVIGQRRPIEARPERIRAFTRAGLQVAFALLCRPELITRNYREIAINANVALGTVAQVIADLQARKVVRFTRPRPAILRPHRLLQDWVDRYPLLRAKLHPKRFQADPANLKKVDLKQYGAFWGGEVAGEKLTGYLKAAQYTIYAAPPLARLAAATRLRADPKGDVEILNTFWNFNVNADYPDVVPPVLAYADLLTTNDDRNIEAARLIYDQRIAPALDAIGPTT